MKIKTLYNSGYQGSKTIAATRIKKYVLKMHQQTRLCWVLNLYQVWLISGYDIQMQENIKETIVIKLYSAA
jgi:hypothetical protein